MKPLELPVRQRDRKNYHICQRCGTEYYRRTGNKPERTTRYCSNDCRYRRKECPLPPTPPSDLVEPVIAGDIVGYSASQVRRLAAANKIAAVGGGGGGRRWRVSLASLRRYIAAAG